LVDKTLTCKDCGRPFLFSAREQQFYAEKGFTNEPHRCKECRQARRAANGAVPPNGGGSRPAFEAVCAACGVTTTVPFKPRGDRPVFCRVCYTSTLSAPATV
jgi:CxxC-x17-CxxC domain-containing protein